MSSDFRQSQRVSNPSAPFPPAPFAPRLPIQDLSTEVRAETAMPLVHFPRQLIDSAVRALYRTTKRHLLITGAKGVGKTAFVQELARVAATGEPDFLKSKRFLWIDCQNVSRDDSRPCLESVLGMAAGQRELILCLDGLASLLRRPGGDDNKSLLKSALTQPEIQVVAVMSRWEFNDLIASDADMLEQFSRIEIEEPGGEFLEQVLYDIARRLERQFHLSIPLETVQRTLSLCSSYIMNEHFPLKASRILRHVCEDLDFERTQHGSTQTEVTPHKVVQVLSGVTGIPETTLMGEAGQPDFEAALASAVVGQPEAIRAVATELRLIKAGLVEPNKPATVLLFAGMTGVGKTELAKRLAELYSTSKRLQTYPMGNFTEPHSVSGIIGVPPGYVGHDQGGRLVNELNADPYSVVLLDEGDKAHPNIWTPFLNLFDEGWLIDQRGTKAYADRSIFVITTNAGADTISQMAASAQSTVEIEDRIKHLLSRIRHERSSQPVFTPQFLARIKKVVIFRPLDSEAMLGIARKLTNAMQTHWSQRRGKTLAIADDVLAAIAERGHAQNSKSGGKEGGRIIRKLLSELIETRIQQEAIEQDTKYRTCHTIHVTCHDSAAGQHDGDINSPTEHFRVAFE